MTIALFNVGLPSVRKPVTCQVMLMKGYFRCLLEPHPAVALVLTDRWQSAYRDAKLLEEKKLTR